jgi:lipoprotein-releasing system permease protein
LNLEYFIAKRLITTKAYKSSISSPIIKIAISAIAIGMIMMIISLATGIGLQQKIQEKLAAFSGHVIIANYDENQSKVSTIPLSIQQNFYPKFKNIDGISHIQAVASKAGIIRTQKAVEGIIFKGVGKDYDWKNLKEYLISGNLPSFSTEINNQVLVSEYLANRLNLKKNDNFNTFFMKEGENRLPNLRRFKIVGIYNSGFQEFDATYIIGDIRHIQKMNHWQPSQIGNFEVFINDFYEIETKGDEIYKNIPSTLNAKTINEKYPLIFEWLQLFDFNILTIIVIMIIVSTINIVVALLVLILERTQMIGILKSIGANNWTIRKIFLYNASYLIIRGLFLGNTIGIGLLLIQKRFEIIKLPPENYFVSVAPVSINLIDIALLNIMTIVICLLILLIPSYIITKISPIKAIQFK